jgi:hypothetical protein
MRIDRHHLILIVENDTGVRRLVRHALQREDVMMIERRAV